MSRDATRETQVPETIAAMVDAGMAKVEDFQSMLLDFDKPAGRPCQFQKHRKGCAVYASRPFGCRYWTCAWLAEADTADLPRPDRSGYVIDIVPDFVTLDDDGSGESVNVEVVQVWIDPRRPEAHRDRNLRAYLDRRGQEGKAALIRQNETEAFTLWPPSMTGGEWREVRSAKAAVPRSAEERIQGIAKAQKVLFNVGA
jgi:hypothetical protein